MLHSGAPPRTKGEVPPTNGVDGSNGLVQSIQGLSIGSATTGTTTTATHGHSDYDSQSDT